MNEFKSKKSLILKIFGHAAGLGTLLAVMALALFFIKYSFVDPAVDKNQYRYINDIYDSPAVSFDHGATLEQPFTTHGDIYGVKIRFHNLGVPQAGSAYMELVEADSNIVVASTTFNTEIMVNDVYTDIFFDKPYYVADYFEQEKGKHNYILRITPDFVNGDDAYMRVWGDSSTGTMAFGVLTYRVNADSLYGWFRLLSLVAMAAAVILYAVCFIFKFKKEIVFVAALFAVSCLFTLVLPPFSSPDEEAHINAAYRLCNDWFEGYTKEDMDWLSVHRRAEDESSVFEEKRTDVFNYEYIYDNLFSLADEEGVETETGVWMVSDFPFVYFMGALGIKLSHVLNLGFVPSMYLGRLFNLLLFAFCAYMAIRITPTGKNMFMVLSLLPITLHLANSFSRDIFVIALGFLFTAFLLRMLAQEEKYTPMQLTALAVVAVFLAPSKFIYCVLCLGLLLLKRENIGLLSRIRFRISPMVFIIAAVVSVVALFGVIMMIRPELIISVLVTLTSEESLETLICTNPDATYTLDLILANPVVILKLVLNTIFENGAYYIKSITGGVLSYNSVRISDAFVIIILGVVLLSFLSEEEDRYTLRIKDRITFGAIAAMVFALVVYLGISWTPVSYTTIYGIQGKYLLPALPMAFLALRSKAVAVKKDIFRPLCFTVALTDIFVALNAFVIIMQR